jgi:hypothetical protein|tara:strand:- start:358 stop:621 length:264 start_codon:yes stop_codon:yes gene_type:complete
MKTKFEINSEIFLNNGGLEKCYEYYEKHYKKDGFLLDKEHEEVYIIFDEQFNFNEGDRIDIFGRTRIVDWKSTDITNRVITYSLDEE